MSFCLFEMISNFIACLPEKIISEPQATHMLDLLRACVEECHSRKRLSTPFDLSIGQEALASAPTPHEIGHAAHT